MANKNNNLFTITTFILLTATFTIACETSCKPTPSPKAPPHIEPSCPRDSLKFGVCVDILGLGNVAGGALTNSPCCSALLGLTDFKVASCLCTALKANVLGLNLDVSFAMSALVSACQKTIPPGFKCE